jgi:Ni,Fe-hydrogenase I cytochrome b subunit
MHHFHKVWWQLAFYWILKYVLEHSGKISKKIPLKKIQKNPLEYIAIKFDTYMSRWMTAGGLQ